ncbi:alpha/beta hydrolase [Nocardia sp. NPDC059229]|uniref:alpha/beta hydrolase n=1 Tax=Nocardia sp. NPDC059229 TaxID=3346778 RepID=UPI003687CF73
MLIALCHTVFHHRLGSSAEVRRPETVSCRRCTARRTPRSERDAEPFAAAGYDVLVFDYRGFGDSEGTPRQRVSYRQQREDYHAAIAVARQLPGVDPERIVLWGTSYSGGHAVAVAAQDRRITAIVAITPAMDGLATLAHVMRRAGAGYLARAAGHGLRDLARRIAKRPLHYVPIVGPPGSPAIMTSPGAVEAVIPVAGPTWRNEVCARAALAVGLNRPTTFAGCVPCPILVQVGTNDSVAPPSAALRVAAKAGPRARIREYPVDHFDIYQSPWQQQAVTDQLEFLTAVLR